MGAPSTRRRRAPTALLRLLEVLVVVGLYRVYALLRNEQGVDDVAGPATVRAAQHGRDVLHLEQLLHLDVEHAVQHAVLALPWLVRLADLYYTTVHLPLTALVLLWLLVTRPAWRYAAWRNVLAIGTVVSLVGFAVFPTMPPRLLPGAGYTDTLATVGGLWSYGTPALEHIAHPFAAMPSLHLVWAGWVGAAVWRCAARRWVRRLGPLHVAVTALVVVATGNHWLLDVVAGLAVLAGAAAVVRALRARQAPTSVTEPRPELVEAA